MSAADPCASSGFSFPASADGGRAVPWDAAPTTLRAQGLTVGYRQRRSTRTLLADLDLDVRAGRLTCLLGPNGSGKTTLLRTLVGTLTPLGGAVRLGDADLHALDPTERARRLGVVLTGGVDAGLLRARDLVALGRHPHTGWSGRLGVADHAAVDWALAATGATALADRPVDELSDGERQRVLIARALAQEPQVLALDEPTAYVDLPRRAELAELLTHLARECGLAVLLTTHDLDLALRTADEVWLLTPAGPGSPGHVDVGAPEDLAADGTVAEAFLSDGLSDVTYDEHRGVFVADGTPLFTVAVSGQEPAATWAARALERAGARVGGDTALELEAGHGGWTLRAGTTVLAEGASFGALAEFVRGRAADLAGLAVPTR